MTNLATMAAALQPRGLRHYLMMLCQPSLTGLQRVLLLMGTGGTDALWTELSFAVTTE